MADRVVSVRLSADVNDFRRGMQQAEQDVSKLSTTTEKTSGGISKFAKGAAGALAGVGLASFATDSIKAASDLQQSLGKTSDIFGAQAKAVQAWSTTSATAFGLSQQAALEAASTFGDMFTQLGFSGDKAAGLSEQVVQLAGDLGAFNNLPTADVLDRIGGAFRGEYDALQKVIPNISAARVQTEAMAATGKKNADSLTAQEKATAVLAIVQRDGAKAAGNYAKTAGDAATQQQTVAAQFENTKAAVGQSLLPVYQSLLSAFQDSLPVIEGIGKAVGGLVSLIADLPGPVKLAAAAFGGFLLLQKANVFSKLATGIASFKQEMAFASYGMSTFGDKAKSIGKSLGAGGLVAGAAVLVSAIVDGFNEHVTPAVVDFSAVLDAATGKLSDAASGALGAAGAFDNLAKAGVGAATYLGALQGNAGDVKATLDSLQGALKAAFASGDDERINAAATALAQFNTDLKGVADAQRHQKQEQDAAKAAMDSYASTLTGAVDAQDRYTGTAEAATSAVVAHRDAVATASGQQERYVSSLLGAAGALDAARAAARANATAVSDAWQPTNLLASALDDVSSAASSADQSAQFLQMSLDKLAGKDIDAEQAARANAAAMREMVSAHRDVAQAKSDVAQKADDLAAAQAKEVKSDYTSEQKARDVANAKRDLAAANDAVKDASDRFKDSQDKAAQSAIAQTDAVFQSTLKTQGYDAAVSAATEKMRGERGAFIAAAEQAGVHGQAASDLADKLGLIPSNVRTTYESNAYSEVAAADALNARISHVDGRVVHYTILGTYATAGAPKGAQVAVAKGAVFMASGGLRQPQVTGQPILWGEAGPEAYIPLANDSRRGRAIDLWHETGKALGVMKMAVGGLPGAASLAGIAPRSPGAREGVSLGALDDILAWVRNVQADAADAAHAASQALQSYREARNAQREAIAAQKAENAERLRGAKTAKERAAAEKRNHEEMARTVASQNAKVNAAIRERTAADRTAAALKAKADAEGRAWNATGRLRGVTGNLTRAYDAATNKLAVDADRLNSLRSDKAQLAGSVASGIRGIGGGVAGFQEQRTTVASILNGAAYNARLAGSFKADLARLAKLGLNAQTLAELSDPNKASTAHILATGGVGDIRRLNSLVSQTNTFATQAGNLVAGSTFDRSINAVQNQVASDQRAQRNLAIALNASAKGLAQAFSDAVDGHIAAVTNQRLAILVRKGDRELLRR